MNKCQFVVTYNYCDGDVNGVIGIYTNPDETMGAIIGAAFDIWDNAYPSERGEEPEFNFKFRHDSSNDLYYDVEIKYPWRDDIDIYRVFYLREGEERCL